MGEKGSQCTAPRYMRMTQLRTWQAMGAAIIKVHPNSCASKQGWPTSCRRASHPIGQCWASSTSRCCRCEPDPLQAQTCCASREGCKRLDLAQLSPLTAMRRSLSIDHLLHAPVGQASAHGKYLAIKAVMSYRTSFVFSLCLFPHCPILAFR